MGISMRLKEVSGGRISGMGIVQKRFQRKVPQYPSCSRPFTLLPQEGGRGPCIGGCGGSASH